MCINTCRCMLETICLFGPWTSGYMHKKQSKSTRRKTRQAKALENARKAPRTFLELLHEANLESLPPHIPSYLRAAVGPPSSTSRRHFCTVCGFTATYTCVRCGMRFCSRRCQNIHNDTRCLKFVAWSAGKLSAQVLALSRGPLLIQIVSRQVQMQICPLCRRFCNQCIFF